MTPGAQRTSRAFVGRLREKDELKAAFADARSGRGALILISGDPGIGKTRLAQELTVEALQDGGSVQWGSCWEAGGAPAYWPWVQLLRGIAAEADEPTVAAWTRAHPGSALGQIVPEIAGPAHPQSIDPEEARFVLFESVTAFLAKAAAARPLVIVFDDLHAADQPSLLLLHFVARRLGDMPVLLVATSRELEVRRHPQLAKLVGEIARLGRTLPLRGLDRGDVGRFVEEVAGMAPEGGVVETIHGATEGNPFFVDQLVRLLGVEGRLDGGPPMVPLVVPEGVREAVRQHLQFLADDHREVLAVASVLGREFDIERLRLIVDQPDVLVAVDEAVAARVVREIPGAPGRFSFAHALIRETLYEDLGPARRAALHHRAAEALEKLAGGEPGPQLPELAHHFLMAIAAAGPQKALDYSVRAAERAMGQLAYEDAAAHYERALHSLDRLAQPDEGRRFELLLALAEALGIAWVARAEPVTREAVAVARRLDRTDLLARAVMAGLLPADERIALIDEVLIRLGPDDPLLRSRLLSRMAGSLQGSAQFDRMLDTGREALELARQVGDSTAVAFALGALHMALGGSERLDERLAISRELRSLAQGAPEPRAIHQAHECRVGDLVAAGDVPALDEELERHAEFASSARLPATALFGVAWRAMRMMLDGRFDEAEPLVLQQLSLDLGLRLPGAQLNSPGLAVQLFHLRREQGRLAEIESFTRGQAEGFGWTPWNIRLALLHLETGREDEARVAFEEIAARNFVDLRRDYVTFSLPLLAEMCAGLRDQRRASTLYDRIVPYDGQCFDSSGLHVFCTGAAARYLGLLAATLDQWDDAERHFQSALDRHKRMGSRPWVAHTQYDHAALLVARGRPGDGERGSILLGEARATAEQLGMMALVRKVDRLLDGDSHRRVETSQPLPALPTSETFRCEGDTWAIAYQGRTFRLRDSKGLRLIARLLFEPGRELHSVDLDRVGSSAGGGTPARPVTSRELADANLGPAADDAGAVLDPKAKADYKRRLDDLAEELEEARAFNDPERAARAEEEIDFLVSELSSAVGLGGRDRRAVAASERARVNVTRAIRSALSRIAEMDRPLGDHLATTIRTGTFCSYMPDPRVPVKWEG